jgi:transposase-like protein
MVVQEIEEGGSFESVRSKYGIGGASTIQSWVGRFGKNHLLNKVIRIETMNDQQRIKQLEEENKKLKLKLAETFMARDCLEGVIDMANKEYKTDLKKNFGGQFPDNSKGDTK